MARVGRDRKIHVYYSPIFIELYKGYIEVPGNYDLLIECGRAYGSSPIQTFYHAFLMGLLTMVTGIEYRSYPGKKRFINGKSIKPTL